MIVSSGACSQITPQMTVYAGTKVHSICPLELWIRETKMFDSLDYRKNIEK